jgi:predicted RecB family endonuclease
VKNALTAAYPDYRIDEADFIEREDGDRYAVEIEKGKLSVMVYVSPEGEILE